MNEKYIRLRFPFLPCSVNKSYAGYKIRHKSNDYKAFEQKMKIYMSCDTRYEIEGDKWLSVKYIFTFPLYFKNGNIRKRDVANFEKTLSDSLSHNISWFFDEKIKELVMIKEDWEKESMEIIIYEI